VFGSAFDPMHDSHPSPPQLSRLASPSTASHDHHHHRSQQLQQQQHEEELQEGQREALPSSSLRRGSSVNANNRSSLPGVDYDAPVVYKQWHSAVTVLFADISSYTAMSTQVEPEQVGLVAGVLGGC
jgi:class 3 adenylate cyclase